MKEIRFHGRGGQGTVVATIILARALFKCGYNVQTFPSFGVERRGAPVEAYLRIDKDKDILMRCNVYTPDHIIVQDRKLLSTINVTSGLKNGGFILVNSPTSPDKMESNHSFRVVHVNATEIAIKNGLGTKTHPMINTAMCGAFSRIMDMPDIDTLATVIQEEIKIKPEGNIKAAREAYDACIFNEL